MRENCSDVKPIKDHPVDPRITTGGADSRKLKTRQCGDLGTRLKSTNLHTLRYLLQFRLSKVVDPSSGPNGIGPKPSHWRDILKK